MASLNRYNYLNLIGFAINAFTTFGAAKILNFPDQTELSAKYSTIITPDGLTFAIWGIIFLSEGIFSVLQMLPAFRSKDIVQKGVGYWFAAACIAQSAWVLAFGYELLILSWLFMGVILRCLFRIITLQSKIPSNGAGEFWGFRFPVTIHCGWIFLAFALNVNVVVVSRTDSEMVQAVFGALSLLGFVGVLAYIQLCVEGGTNFTILGVFAWASAGIVRALSNAPDNITAIFSNQVIQGFQYSAGIFCAGVLLTIAVLFYKLRKDKKEEQEADFVPNPASPLLD